MAATRRWCCISRTRRCSSTYRFDELEHYVTERGNPGNHRRIREAEIQLPADLLRSGFRFIDTPGLGSPVAGNTATTQGFLPEADAFLLVSGFDGALTDEEAAIFSVAHDAGRRVFVVLNKADMIGAQQRADHVAALRARLGPLGLPDDEPVYPVSARDALAFRLARTPAGPPTDRTRADWRCWKRTCSAS